MALRAVVSCKLMYIIVKKRISERFIEPKTDNSHTNPPPGTVVDSIVTRPQSWVFRSETDLLSLVILFLLGRPLQKSLRLRRFKTNLDEICQECSSGKCASTDLVRFLIWWQNFSCWDSSLCTSPLCHGVARRSRGATVLAAHIIRQIDNSII